MLRKNSNTKNLEITVQRAVRALSGVGIPSLVVGGYAVQEHGYAYTTNDVDLVVPDVAASRERLSINGFKPNPGSKMTLTDRDTKVEVDLLPGGGSVGPGPIMLPMPTEITVQPNVVDLKTLIELKLSSYLGSPVTRSKDRGAVVELIKANSLPRNFALDSKVQDEYDYLWTGLEAEKSRE